MFYCYNNQLTSLNITQNTGLTNLLCDSNQLTSLDVTQNSNLIYLYCHANQLTSLDVSQNFTLSLLSCMHNPINILNITQNSNLSQLICVNNQLTTLDISQNLDLVLLACNDNQLSNLNITHNVTLNQLYCSNNSLSCLNVKNGNNVNFSIFESLNNPNLTCIEVDNTAYSTTNWTNIDIQTSFSTSCTNPCSVGIEEKKFTNLSLYPIPTNKNITIDFGEIKQDVKATLTNNLGQIIMSENYTSIKFITLNIDTPKGIYFLQLENDGKVITKKVIKE
tara:strand:- start:244 stop:1077 length:834 start_codon:yes stop_codon:yes gene_type:complete